MGENVTRLVWCDVCCAENWDDVSRWVWGGVASTRSGELKIATRCRSCEAELPVGSSVEAITLHHGRPGPREWEDEYLANAGEVPHGWSEV